MCYTIGMILGPALGGWLGATGDYYFAAKLSAVGSLLSAGLTLFMPSSGPSAAASKPSPQSSPTKSSSALKEAYFTIVKVVSAVWLLLSTKVLTGVANAMNGYNNYGRRIVVTWTNFSYIYCYMKGRLNR